MGIIQVNTPQGLVDVKISGTDPTPQEQQRIINKFFLLYLYTTVCIILVSIVVVCVVVVVLLCFLFYINKIVSNTTQGKYHNI